MIRKILLWFQIRALEAMIDGRDSIRHLITDPLTCANMSLAQHRAHQKLLRLRRNYYGHR